MMAGGCIVSVALMVFIAAHEQRARGSAATGAVREVERGGQSLARVMPSRRGLLLRPVSLFWIVQL